MTGLSVVSRIMTVTTFVGLSAMTFLLLMALV